MISHSLERTLLILPLLLVLFSGFAIFSSYSETGYPVHRDIDFSGGVQLTVHYQDEVDISDFEAFLKDRISTPDIRVRTSSDLTTGIQRTVNIETSVEDEVALESAVGEYLGFQLSDENRSITQFNSMLAASFWLQVQHAFLFAFAMMVIILFFYFRNIHASLALIFPILLDIFVVIGLMSFFGISLSLASFAAIMMLLGYGIDSNIVLANHMLKQKEGSVDERISRARRTGITMAATTIAALSAMYLFSTSSVLQSISIVLVLGLISDLVNTWILNVYLLRRLCL